MHTYCEATGSWSKTGADTMHSALFVKIRPGNTPRVKHPHDLHLNYMLLQTYIFTTFFNLKYEKKLVWHLIFLLYIFLCGIRSNAGLYFFYHQKECICGKAGITQWSPINSTFGLHNGQKDRKFACSPLWNIVFLTREEGGSWESKDSGFLLGSWVERGASRMKQGTDGGSKCQRPAVQQAWRSFDSVAMLLAFGRRYPFPQAHRWRGFSWYEEERKDGRRKGGKVLFTAALRVWWRRWRGGGGRVFGRQVVVRVGAVYLSLHPVPEVITRLEQLKPRTAVSPECHFPLEGTKCRLEGSNLSASYLHEPDLVMYIRFFHLNRPLSGKMRFAVFFVGLRVRVGFYSRAWLTSGSHG